MLDATSMLTKYPSSNTNLEPCRSFAKLLDALYPIRSLLTLSVIESGNCHNRNSLVPGDILREGEIDSALHSQLK